MNTLGSILLILAAYLCMDVFFTRFLVKDNKGLLHYFFKILLSKKS